MYAPLVVARRGLLYIHGMALEAGAGESGSLFGGTFGRNRLNLPRRIRARSDQKFSFRQSEKTAVK